LKASPARTHCLLVAGSVLGFLTACLSSSWGSLLSIGDPFASAIPNGGFATIRGVVKIESKIQPRSHAINFYSRRGGPAVPPKPAAPVNELENVVVYLENFRATEGPFPRRQATPEPTIRQVNETFIPQVLAIQTGDTVHFPNDDPFFHNVFSLSGARSFDLGRYPKNQVRSVRFDRPGIIKVFCHIHSHMNAVIRVFDHPYFCKAASNGMFSIPHVPEGTYTVVAWHERLKLQRQVIRVESGETPSVDFAL
jgi:plastocyanin